MIPPLHVFERRAIKTYYTIRVSPWYGKETEYKGWFDVALPIILVTGPIVAAVSVLAIPIAAVAVGGSALAALSGFGAALTSGAATAVELTASAGVYAARAAVCIVLQYFVHKHFT